MKYVNSSSNMLTIIFSAIVSFLITVKIVNDMDLPIIKDTTGAAAAGLYNLIIGYPMYLMLFIPIMAFFMIIFIFVINYILDKYINI